MPYALKYDPRLAFCSENVVLLTIYRFFKKEINFKPQYI